MPPGFKPQGPASFEVFREQAPGSVPVYMFTIGMSDGTLVYYYSRDPQPPSKAWEGPGTAFYAYAEEHPNSVPVYCFSKEQSGTKVYFYSSIDNPPPGYSKQGSPSFWAPASSRPVYTYINNAALGSVYYYSIKRYTPQSFQAAGPATFNAFDKPAWNRVKVFVFTIRMSDGTLVYYYSRDPNPPSKGWEGPGLAFYAYAEERPGSVPVYEFTKKLQSGTKVYFYSSIDNPPQDYSKKGFLSFYAPAPVPDPLSTFDHVVVLMLENRSLDNLLGYLYPTGVPKNAPLGKTFEGLAGPHIFSNPVPKDAKHQPPDGSGSVPEASAENYFTPYPDPGEEYQHINVQLYQTPTPASGITDKPAGMQGFVQDYIDTCKSTLTVDPTFKQYQQIMQSFSDDDVPVLSTLAREFAVFDHWFCSVPSQTWCNRAFWHAGNSRGHVNNIPPFVEWFHGKRATTLFNQIKESYQKWHLKWGHSLTWRIYTSKEFESKWKPQFHVSLTWLIHERTLARSRLFGHSSYIDSFFSDCENGQLPSYSFLEPKFFTPHNDMHPSSYGSKRWGKGKVGSVKLGEQLVARVYNAIRNSKSPKGNNASNTLLIITFDEHGGTYDHVPPPTKATPPDLSGFHKEDGFDFTRPGLRVPTIMVSAHIARNTVVNTPMDHTSFLKTIHKKWNAESEYQFQALSAREQASPDFAEVFTSQKPRDAAHWPVIDEPKIPKEVWETDYSQEPLSSLQRSIVEGLKIIRREQEGETTRSAELKAAEETEIKTVGQALEFLKSVSREGLESG